MHEVLPFSTWYFPAAHGAQATPPIHVGVCASPFASVALAAASWAAWWATLVWYLPASHLLHVHALFVHAPTPSPSPLDRLQSMQHCSQSTSTAVKRDDEIRDEIGLRPTLTENYTKSRTLLARARALAPCRA